METTHYLVNIFLVRITNVFESRVTELFIGFSVFGLAGTPSPLIGKVTPIHQTLDGRADPREVAFCFRHLMRDVIIDCLFYTLCNNVPIVIDRPVNMIRLEIRSDKRVEGK